MSVQSRLRKSRHHLDHSHRSDHKTESSPAIRPRPQAIPASQKDQGKAAVEVVDHYLATQRKPLEDVEPIWILRWLLRRYFAWRGFACRSHCGKCDGKCYASIEYRGTYERKSDAYWAANCHGGEVKPIPFFPYRAALPEETVEYGARDVPQCEDPEFYRNGVALPFKAVSREQWDELERKVEQVYRSAQA